MKTLLAVLALAVTPTLAAAQGCQWDKETTASACAAGQVFDAETKTCVTTSS